MSAPEVIVIDYGMGNLLSVRRGFEHCGAIVNLTSEPDLILAGQRVVLPGVGAFRDAMQALHDLNLISVIHTVVKRDTPFLGICLGMQLLLEQSEEFGVTEGLGIIPGRVQAIPRCLTNGEPVKSPHIGWNAIFKSKNVNWQRTLLANNRSGDEMYFVHSFVALPASATDRIADCVYGGYELSAVIGRGNVTGCQFHPEKSGELGLKILRQFLKR